MVNKKKTMDRRVVVKIDYKPVNSGVVCRYVKERKIAKRLKSIFSSMITDAYSLREIFHSIDEKTINLSSTEIDMYDTMLLKNNIEDIKRIFAKKVLL